MIYTFYSYKGGVGRSMALVNVAELMCRTGRKVIMVDWDLEAPGLEKFYPEQSEQVLKSPGIIDLLISYKEKAARYRPESPDPLLSLDDVSSLLIDMHPNESIQGKLWLLPAGQRASERFVEYANRVKTFDWQDFYQNWEGEVYFEWLRQQLLSLGDVVLIDARTGVTEMGGVTTYQLADVVVMLCTANQQNLEGTQQMVDSFSNPNLPELRHGRELKVLVVPARVERLAETARLNQFREDFAKRFQGHLLDFQPIGSTSLVDLEIPYVPLYAFEEKIAVFQGSGDTRSVELENAYGELHKVLSLQQVSQSGYAPQSMICADLDLVIERKTSNGPLVVTASSQIGTIQQGIKEPDSILDFSTEWVSSDEAIAIGTRLFGLIFTGELLAHYRRCRRSADQSNASFQIKIDARDAGAALLPWEYLYDDERKEFLALSQRASLVRSIKSSRRPLFDIVGRPLRILGIGASPRDMAKLDLGLEIRRLRSAIEDLLRSGQAEFHWQESPTLIELQSILRKGPWHVVHYTGMGVQGMIFLVDDAGRAQSVTTKQLDHLLTGLDSLRLVVLNCARSATLAASLVRSGIPAAIGMQSDLSDAMAIQFSSSFYQSIAAGNSIENAFTEARITISLVADQDTEWAAPVLYVSQNENVLFRLDNLPQHLPGD